MEYLKLRAIMATAEQESGFSELGFASREMLVEIGLAAEVDGKPMHVTDLTRSERHGTLPTVVKRISDLVEDGWVVKTESPEDGRAKILSLSPKSENTFRKMSKTVRKHYTPA
jgi:DNA-binding PadR family transcriptional regulator